jgi:protoporphyrinogen oxidase
LPGISLTGSSYRGVGLPDCIKAGKDTAATITWQTAALPEPSR